MDLMWSRTILFHISNGLKLFETFNHPTLLIFDWSDLRNEVFWLAKAVRRCAVWRWVARPPSKSIRARRPPICDVLSCAKTLLGWALSDQNGRNLVMSSKTSNAVLNTTPMFSKRVFLLKHWKHWKHCLKRLVQVFFCVKNELLLLMLRRWATAW